MGERVSAAGEGESFAERIAAVLRDNERRIVLNWATRIGALPEFRARAELELSALLGGVPRVVDELLRLLGRDPTPEVPPLDLDIGAAGDHAAAHARARVGLGLRPSVVVSEYVHLRQVLWSEVRAAAAAIRATVADLFGLERRLNAAIDALMVVTLVTFEQEQHTLGA